MTKVAGRGHGGDSMGFNQAADEARAEKRLKAQQKQQAKVLKATAKLRQQGGETLFEAAQLVRKNIQNAPQTALTPVPKRP